MAKKLTKIKISKLHPACHVRWMSQQMAQNKPSYVCLSETSTRQMAHSVRTYLAQPHSVTLEKRNICVGLLFVSYKKVYPKKVLSNDRSSGTFDMNDNSD